MDLIFPNEGLADTVWNQIQSWTNVPALTCYCDVFTAPSTPPTLATMYASLTLGVVSGAFSATGGAAPGNQLTSGVMGSPVFISGGSLSIGPTVVFTNISGSSQSVYGYALYFPSSSFASGPVLAAIAALDGAPVIVPNGQTISITPVWGQLSQLSS